MSLLSDLCSICNTNAFKYRCPGCNARTCSLPCYKRHQQWAQCSGQRDPTKFVKKSHLVTPAGIDHDYNFLSRIERNLERAEVTANAVGGDPASTNNQQEVNYRKLQSSGVKVIRAPKGLSRQKENKSHPSSTKKAKHNFVWTVEWYGETRRRVLTQTSSTERVQDADPFSEHEQHKKKQRKIGPTSLQTTTEGLQTTTATIPTSAQKQGHEHHRTNQDEPFKQLDIDRQLKNDEPKPELLDTGSRTTSDSTSQSAQGQTGMATSHPRDDGNHESSGQPIFDGQHRFFLLKPRTSSTRQVLIPLDPSHKLGECIAGRTVLEFPTIYVFSKDMTELPKEFMLEEDYIKLEGEEQKEFDELIHELDPAILRRLRDDTSSRAEEQGEEVDSKKILDVLKQDLGGVL